MDVKLISVVWTVTLLVVCLVVLYMFCRTIKKYTKVYLERPQYRYRVVREFTNDYYGKSVWFIEPMSLNQFLTDIGVRTPEQFLFILVYHPNMKCWIVGEFDIREIPNLWRNVTIVGYRYMWLEVYNTRGILGMRGIDLRFMHHMRININEMSESLKMNSAKDIDGNLLFVPYEHAVGNYIKP